MQSYLPLPRCFMTFGGKMSYINFGGKIFNGFTQFLIQWYPKLSTIIMKLFLVGDLF
jgi:hypothetical protein